MAPHHAPDSTSPGTSRRTILRTAAWSVPAVSLAAAAPAFAASTDTNVGNFSLNGVCGLLGTVGPGFVLQAGAEEALPAGTSITITDSGLLSVDALPVITDSTGTQLAGVASVTALGGGDANVVLNQPVPAGGSIQIRWIISLGVVIRKNATVTLPSGFISGPTAKTSGALDQTAIFCNGS